MCIILEISIIDLDNISFHWLECLLEKDREVDFPDETDALRILLVRRGKVGFRGYPPYFRFLETSYREKGA